jgi:hypothetical protein
MTLDFPIITVTLIVAITAFFKKQFSLSGWRVLLVAFIVSLIISLAPLLSTTFPAVAPWVEQVIKLVVMFLAASGSVDFVTEVRRSGEGTEGD